MYKIGYKSSFYDDFRHTVKDESLRGRIKRKTLGLEYRNIGKKLKDSPYGSLRVGKFRIIYRLDKDEIVFLRVIWRERNYKELKGL
jgi:mRNA-degrading endonuclease RelE of RelBE toxin-antitoxin system